MFFCTSFGSMKKTRRTFPMSVTGTLVFCPVYCLTKASVHDVCCLNSVGLAGFAGG